MLSTNISAREQRARNTLAKHNMYLKKMPSRSSLRSHGSPGYMVLEDNIVRTGGSPREYSDTIDEVEYFCQQLEASWTPGIGIEPISGGHPHLPMSVL